MASVPEVIEALHAALSADPQLSDVDVTDGPEVTDSGALDWILVGYTGEPESEAVAVDHAWSSSLSTQPADRIRITNTIVCGSGDTDVKAARTRAYELFSRVRAIVRANPGLGLPQVQSFVEAHRLYQDQSPDGIQMRIAFTLTADTFGV